MTKGLPIVNAIFNCRFRSGNKVYNPKLGNAA
jgi:hypothetical protein